MPTKLQKNVDSQFGSMLLLIKPVKLFEIELNNKWLFDDKIIKQTQIMSNLNNILK